MRTAAARGTVLGGTVLALAPSPPGRQQQVPLPPSPRDRRAEGRLAEDAWNSRDPARVALAYTLDSRWRNRAEFLQGREAIEAFLTRKWRRELEYRLIKEVWAFGGNRIAVRFAYEWHDDAGFWFRSYGNENWEFDAHGLMRARLASINDLPFARTNASTTGRSAGADDHPSLSDLGLYWPGRLTHRQPDARHPSMCREIHDLLVARPARIVSARGVSAALHGGSRRRACRPRRSAGRIPGPERWSRGAHGRPHTRPESGRRGSAERRRS